MINPITLTYSILPIVIIYFFYKYIIKSPFIPQYETVVIGGGPAGLAAGISLKERNKSFIIIESGKDAFCRDRYDKEDLILGIGGAGLFSDGKFSFYPSSTNLWKLANKILLSNSYEWMYKLLSGKVLSDIPNYPIVVDTHYSENQWVLKEYPSIYMELNERYKLIADLSEKIGGKNIMINSTVTNYIKNEDGDYLIKIETKGQCKEIKCKNIIVSAGRFWPHHQYLAGRSQMTFMRLEYGVRIQDDCNQKFFTHTQLNDPKYKYLDENIEFRTFCCCRNGEIIVTQSGGIQTCSGRSDCSPTKLSNTGFNVRILDQKTSDSIVQEGLFYTPLFNNIPMIEAIETNILLDFYGATAHKYMIIGLKLLLEKFPELKTSQLFGPTIEGVGSYQKTDGNMKIDNENIWICGDAGGKFRGITAALVSGHYVGKMIP